MRHNADFPGHRATPEAPNRAPANQPVLEQDPLSDAKVKQALENALRKVESKGRQHTSLDNREQHFDEVPLSVPDPRRSARRQQRSKFANKDEDWQQITANDAQCSSYNSQADHKWKYDEELQSEQASETTATRSQDQGYVGGAKSIAAWGLERVSSGLGTLLRRDSKEQSDKSES